MLFSRLAVLVGLVCLSSAHFFLETPISVGFDDEELTVAPCGGFDPSDRSAGVTQWPVLGYPVALITTHLNVNWTFKAALLSDLENWVDIFPRTHQTGIAEFCLPQVPGVPDWIGEDAVVQIVSEAPDGFLHQYHDLNDEYYTFCYYGEHDYNSCYHDGHRASCDDECDDECDNFLAVDVTFYSSFHSVALRQLIFDCLPLDSLNG
ncbi:hypothetical protein ABW19_dt0203329 [Dactylella cylindrospora]|nr:hypothetical protein ABW19_dt0203329 [Dactylella cylindrospora]